MKFQFNLLVIFCLVLSACNEKTNHPTLSVEHQKAIDNMSIMDGFKIEQVVAEPLITDPVAMEIDENGKLYVVEMPGYPVDLAYSGKIKLLKDTNKDGFPDKSVVFADSFLLPTGIMRWKKGFLITDVENVIYIEDTNNDDKADIRKVVITGFARTNPQHNLNSPILGIDNWIYLAHQGEVTPFVYKKEFGDEGREITFVNQPNALKLAKNSNGRNVRFRPDSFEMEELSGDSQFGHTFDAWGHHFLTENAKHLYFEAIAARYLKRNPDLLIPEATQAFSDHEDASVIYPTTESPNHELLTDQGVITSSCGITWYLADKFGDNFNNVTFIAEPSHNLVHADVIKDNGASFTGSRLLEKKDFLASKDSWFRPVNFYIGPDGALYVIDYYRQHIEHPEWMSEEMIKSGTLYNGKDKGRIYRIVPKDGLPMDWMDVLKINELSDEELVTKSLDHPNIWHRRTAQRLLADRNSAASVEPLKKLVQNAKNPAAKVHALWLLEKMNKIDKSILDMALNDETAGVQENAIKIFEKINDDAKKAGKPLLDIEMLEKLKSNKSPKVRYQLLCTLGNDDSEKASKLRFELFNNDAKDKWFGIAAISGANGNEIKLLNDFISFYSNKEYKGNQDFLTYLSATIANKGSKENINTIFNIVETKPIDNNAKAALIKGIAKLWEHKAPNYKITDEDKAKVLAMFKPNTSNELLKSVLLLLKTTGLPSKNTSNYFEMAQNWLNDTKIDNNRKTIAIELLALQKQNSNILQFQNLVVNSKSDEIHLAAFEALAFSNPKATCKFSLENWPKLSSKIKSKATDLVILNESEITAFLKAIEIQKIPKTDILWPQMVSLMNYDKAAVRDYARKVLAIDENRKVVVQKYLAALDLKGDAAKGQTIFQNTCSVCHILDNSKGNDFGPNLTSIKNRNPASILTEIINPNNSIADKFDQYTLHFKNKKTEIGIIKNQNTSSVTLRQMGGVETVFSKSDIDKIEKNTISAMPNGLENSISIQQMADLIAFIKK